MKTKQIFFILLSSLLVVIILFGLDVYVNKAYYPDLPFEGASKKIVVDKMKKSKDELVELADNNRYYWLGFKGNQGDGRDKIIRDMENQGLKYDYYEGAGIFFKNEHEERIVVTGTMWTRNYVMYKVPQEKDEAV